MKNIHQRILVNMAIQRKASRTAHQERASSAKEGLIAFKSMTGVDKKDAVSELLRNLMHLCEEDPALGTFTENLRKAAAQYNAEIESEITKIDSEEAQFA